MKTYLKKSNYESMYQCLTSKYNLIIIPTNWDEVMSESELTKIILTSNITATYTKQSLVRLAKYCYGRYYNVMRYLLLRK